MKRIRLASGEELRVEREDEAVRLASDRGWQLILTLDETWRLAEALDEEATRN